MAGRGVARRGELERAVLHVLWDNPDGTTAREVLDALPDRDLAMTTVLTVLDRLRGKGLAERDDSARPHVYRATQTREDYIADLMLDALGQAPDRGAVLSRFLGAVSDTDTDHLRRALRRANTVDVVSGADVGGGVVAVAGVDTAAGVDSAQPLGSAAPAEENSQATVGSRAGKSRKRSR